MKTNNETKTEIESLIRNNVCHLSKVTWPRHTDGTFDYDDIATAATSNIMGMEKSESANAPDTERAKPAEEEKKHSLPNTIETNGEIKTDYAIETNTKEDHADFVFPFKVGFGIILTIALLLIVLAIAKKMKGRKE